MERPTIINLMRNMKVDRPIPLEEVSHIYPNVTKIYHGRPEMVVMKMTNGRNMQMFRGGTVQILGCVSDMEAENMRLEFIVKLRRINMMHNSQVTKLTVSNLVISVQLTKAICLQKIASTDADFFHEIELFPAALIRKWHPVHIAVFHTGRVILTGLKSDEHFIDIMNTLTSFLETSHVLLKE
jgi:TATA-box binding protein (TBP) (component of TFIID and TFIIIB)